MKTNEAHTQIDHIYYLISNSKVPYLQRDIKLLGFSKQIKYSKNKKFSVNS